MKKKKSEANDPKTEQTIERVKLAALQSPNRSIRLRASNSNLSETSLRLILKVDLKFHPYKKVMCEQLFERDVITTCFVGD